MKSMKLIAIVMAAAMAFATFGCAHDLHGNRGDASQAAQSGKIIEKEDGSAVATTTDASGVKTEVRTFKTGDVASVTRTTHTNGKRTATVEFRDGRKVDLDDDNDIESVIDASADKVSELANDAWDATKRVGKEVGDKSEDVAGEAVDKGKDVGKAVGKGAKRGAQEAGDAAGDAAQAVGKGAKKAGKEAKKIGGKIKDGVTP